MRANHEGFTSDTKELGLQSVTHKFAGILSLKDFIKALLENGTIPELVNSQVFFAPSGTQVSRIQVLPPCCSPIQAAIFLQRFACSIQNLRILSSLLAKV